MQKKINYNLIKINRIIQDCVSRYENSVKLNNIQKANLFALKSDLLLRISLQLKKDLLKKVKKCKGK